jgi:hypothetical protein
MDFSFSPLAQVSQEQLRLILIAGALGGYLLLMLTNPVRSSFRDGLRCLQRYHALWSILAIFGFCYALFQIGLRFYYWWILPVKTVRFSNGPGAWEFSREHLVTVLQQSILPAAESVAGLFNNIVTTYPFSAGAAVLLLVNWQGHYAVLNRSLRRKFGGFGWVIFLGISICAVAAILKPALYFMPAYSARIPEEILLQLSSIIDWLSFLFEYLFGVCIQVYLILMVFAWVRGIHFTHSSLLDVAIRRLSYIMRWAAIVILISTLFIHLPLILMTFPGFSQRIPAAGTLRYIDTFARPLLCVFLLLYPAVQITLTFHSEKLRKAVQDNRRFLWKNARNFLWFLLIAALHFFILTLLNLTITAGFGEGTNLVLGWSLIYPLIYALVAGWLLASWVCFFKKCEAGESKFEVKF